MIHRTCDRCRKPVGKFYDGGKDVKYNTNDYIPAIVGMRAGATIDFCGECADALVKALQNWLDNK